MKPCFIWLFITFYVTAMTSADLGRSKRDLARIQSIINWLLGINEERLIQTIPLVEEERQRIHTLPAYQKLLVRTIPRTEINEGLRQILADGLYREKSYRPLQTVRNSYPHTYNNYYVAQQDYRNDRPYGAYMSGMPMYPYIYKEPRNEETIPFPPNTILPCDYCNGAVVTEIRKPPPQHPIFIQNRIREVMLKHALPTITLQKDVIVPPPNLRKVDVSEYPVVDIRFAKQGDDSMSSIKQIKPVTSLTKPKLPGADFDNVFETYKYGTENVGSVHTIRKHQINYNNQLDKNGNRKVNDMHTKIVKSNHTAPIVIRQDDIVIAPPTINTKETSNNSYEVTVSTTLPTKSNNEIETKSNRNEIDIKGRVTFEAPVHTKYKYKMIYHNQPKKDTVVEIAPPNLKKETVTGDTLVKNKETSNKTKEVIVSTTLATKLNNEMETKSIANEIDNKGKLKFKAPVQTKYQYKMIYHNQPEKNTVVEMNSMLSQTGQSKEKTDRLTDQTNNPASVAATQYNNAADYIYIPPINTEMPPPGLPRVKTIKKESPCGDDYIAAEANDGINKCSVAVEDLPLLNSRNNNNPTRVIVRRRKLKSSLENYNRGDIPEHVL